MTVWLEIIAFRPLSVVGTTPWLCCSPRFHSIMHLHLHYPPSALPPSSPPIPAGAPLIIIFPHAARSLIGFSRARKIAVVDDFDNDPDLKSHRYHKSITQDSSFANFKSNALNSLRRNLYLIDLV